MKDTEKAAYTRLLEVAETERFYGEVTFRFRDGKLFQISKNQSIKPEDLVKP